MATHQAKNVDGTAATVNFNEVPDECPLCHTKGTFSSLGLYYNGQAIGDRQLEIIYRCPNFKCQEVFIGYYERNPNGHFYLKRTAPRQHIPRRFSDTIRSISTEFPVIYNQALRAEGDNLNQICGPGYRKSLEFLIKDYLTGRTNDAAQKEVIKSEPLGTCIANRIQDTSIKNVAKRAAWLGNDETHYVRKWEQKDLQDLKKLIDLTVHWMEAEALTAELMKDMPEGSV